MEIHGQFRAVNICPNVPLRTRKLIRRLQETVFDYRSMVRHEKRARKHCPEYCNVLILMSRLTNQSYKFVSQYFFFLRDFQQSVLKQGVASFQLSVPATLCFDDKVRELCQIKEKLMKDGFARYKDGTFISQGEGLEDGIYHKKKEYVIRRISSFSKVYYDDLVRLYGIPYHQRDSYVQMMMEFALLGGTGAFISTHRRIDRKHIYKDDFLSVVMHHRNYYAQINGEEEFEMGDFRNYIDHKFSGHCSFQHVAFRLKIQGDGVIIIGEKGFNRRDIIYETRVSISRSELNMITFDRSQFMEIPVVAPEVQEIVFFVPFTQLLMTMKKISLLFRGKFNIYSMSVTVRLWNTSVCIADESCSLRCKKLSILCERRDECIKAPISACLKCRGQYLRTIYDESVNLTNDAIFKFLCKSRDMRETFESLKNDFF